MKMRLILSLFSMAAFLLTGCSEEEMNTEMTRMATCEDGIQNGDETGIDCGGSCMPCDDGEPSGRRAQLFVTNNNDGAVTLFDLTAGSRASFSSTSTAAEGIFYDAGQDYLVQASRSNLRLEGFSGVSMLEDGAPLMEAATGSADLESPREIAVCEGNYVVADNGSNKLYIYALEGGSFNLRKTVQAPFPLWGITFKGNDLYAVVDTTKDLAVFYNFLDRAVDGPMFPSKRVGIEGIVRTHGLDYDSNDDVMVMTDIGDAANTADDGGFHIIDDFSLVFDALSDGDLLPLSAQIRVAGPSTLMGNPIDVAYDSETDAVYISEIGNGKVLGFTGIGNGGDLAPSLDEDLMAASSLYFSSDETDDNRGESSMPGQTWLYATNNSDGNITVFDGNGNFVKAVGSASAAAEGIFYDGLRDAVIQASRDNLSLEYYGNFSGTMDGEMLTPDFSGTADLDSPREIAVRGDKVVVSDNGSNQLFVYSYSGSSFTLENTFMAEFPLWGITFKGDDLLAVVDTTGDLAVYAGFLAANTTDGTVSADKVVTIEGIVRTHGIDYSESDDVLVMTDIGDAANATDDGGFHVIADFSVKFDALSGGGTLALSDQSRIAGALTLMGNPIDIAYDPATGTVFIAEIGNSKILSFTDVLNTVGNVSPTVSFDLASASSLYLYRN